MNIKVFTSNEDAETAGDVLTAQIELWKASYTRGLMINNIHTNSNEYGWMIVITYTPN